MALIIFIILVVAAGIAFYSTFMSHNKTGKQDSQPTHFDLLDENGDPIKEQKVEIILGGGDSDAPVQELQYFCIKDKGYHVSVWPKAQRIGDYLEFNIAGMNYRTDIDKYIGEFVGTLESEPANPYDPNAIKVLATDGHHVGYVPKDMTTEIRSEARLPCSCYCYIGCNDGIYYSDCYILRKNH